MSKGQNIVIVGVFLRNPPTVMYDSKKENRSYERFSLCLSCQAQLAFFRALFFT